MHGEGPLERFLILLVHLSLILLFGDTVASTRAEKGRQRFGTFLVSETGLQAYPRHLPPRHPHRPTSSGCVWREVPPKANGSSCSWPFGDSNQPFSAKPKYPSVKFPLRHSPLSKEPKTKTDNAEPERGRVTGWVASAYCTCGGLCNAHTCIYILRTCQLRLPSKSERESGPCTFCLPTSAYKYVLNS